MARRILYLYDETSPEDVVGLINIGARYSSINIVKGGTSSTTGDVQAGGGEITDDLSLVRIRYNAAKSNVAAKEKQTASVLLRDAKQLVDSGQHNEAAQLLRRAYHSASAGPRALRAALNLAMQMKEYSLAINIGEKLMRIQSNDFEVMYLLAFGAYLGLLRQVSPGDDEGHRVRRDAIDRIVDLCAKGHVSETAAIPPLTRALEPAIFGHFERDRAEGVGFSPCAR